MRYVTCHCGERFTGMFRRLFLAVHAFTDHQPAGAD